MNFNVSGDTEPMEKEFKALMETIKDMRPSQKEMRANQEMKVGLEDRPTYWLLLLDVKR